MIPVLGSTRYEQTTDEIIGASAAYFAGFIRKVAFMIAGGDRQLAQDLEQEALILLWELDPTRFDPSDEGYVKSALRRRMLRAFRDERRRAGGSRRVSWDDRQYTP